MHAGRYTVTRDARRVGLMRLAKQPMEMGHAVDTPVVG